MQRGLKIGAWKTGRVCCSGMERIHVDNKVPHVSLSCGLGLQIQGLALLKQSGQEVTCNLWLLIDPLTQKHNCS